MAPNADFDTFDENDETVMNSFLLSNIAPQHHGFNAGKVVRESFFFQACNVTYNVAKLVYLG